MARVAGVRDTRCGDRAARDRRTRRCASCPIAPSSYDTPEDHFKYGSTGGEVNLGFPLWIWQAMPLLCADMLPAARLAPDYSTRVANPKRGSTAADLRALSREGYKSLGLIYEQDAKGQEKDLPIGVSMRRNLGLDRVFVNCAVCHSSTVRDAPAAPRRIVLGMPANLFDLYGFEHFFFSCAKDERFNKHNVMPNAQALGADLDLIDRYLVYPIAVWLMGDQVKLLESRLGFSAKQPPWGPGPRRHVQRREGDLRLAMEDSLPDWSAGQPIEPTSLGTADFPSIWLQACAQEARGRPADAIALGRQQRQGRGAQSQRRVRHRRAAADRRPPGDRPHRDVAHRVSRRPPIRIRSTTAPPRAAQTLYATYCADCHGASGRDFSGARVGFVTPIESIGTDRYRLDNYVPDLAVNQGTLYAGTPYRFSHFRKTFGYANMPLDGLWLRAPYLHNGSVPIAARAARARRTARPKVFYRGNDVYDTANVGFVSDVADERGRGVFPLRHVGARQRQCRSRGTRLRHRAFAAGQGGARRIPEDVLAPVETRGRMKREARAASIPWTGITSGAGSSIGIVVAALLAVGGYVAWYKFFREEPQPAWVTQDADTRFKYGSIGAENDAGIPYWIFYVLPRMFPGEAARTRRLRVARRAVGTGPGTAGGIHEEGDRLSARRATTAPSATARACALPSNATPIVIAAGPGPTTNVEGFFRFFVDCAKDPRFTPDNVLWEIMNVTELVVARQGDLSLPDHSDHEEAAARARAAVRVGVPRRVSRNGAAAATTR